MFVTIITFIIVFSILILVHELGHFFTAKKFGAKVEEFGFGYPPRIFGIKKGETIYSINWIPFGGFVKILGENMEDENKDHPKSFASKSFWQRFLMIFSGVAMNILLAVLLFSIGNIMGIPQEIPDKLPSYANIEENSRRVLIVNVLSNSPAEKAGVNLGDEIQGIITKNGFIEISQVEEVLNIVKEQKGNPVILKLKRNDEILQKEILLRTETPEDQGPMGVALTETAIVSYPWHLATYRGIVDVFNLAILLCVLFFELIKNLLTSGTVGMEVAGPVGIAVMTGKVAKLGFVYLMQFTAMISVNLAIINLFPLPALDGGRLLFLLIEKIKGKPISRNIENVVHTIGFFLLIILMILVTYKDIVRYFF